MGYHEFRAAIWMGNFTSRCCRCHRHMYDEIHIPPKETTE